MAAKKKAPTKRIAKERPVARSGKMGRPRGKLTADSHTSYFASMAVGDKQVESMVLEGGFNDAADAKMAYQVLRNRLGPIFQRLASHAQYAKQQYATHSGSCIATNGDIIISLIVERTK